MELNFFDSSPLHLLGLEAMFQGIKVAGIGGFFFCLCYSLKLEVTSYRTTDGSKSQLLGFWGCHFLDSYVQELWRGT
jgi:hypothetical protein